MSIKLVYKGSQADIFGYVDSRGKTLSSDFIDNLLDREQKKIVRLLQEFADRGKIWNREKFRVEENPIYAFKSYQVRILCFFLPDADKTTVVLTHGFKKKKDEMPPSELEKAKRIFKEISSTSSNEEEI